MYIWLIIWLVVLFAGLVVLLPVYASLIRLLQDSHPEKYRQIGSPTLFMVSPRRGIRLQKFIYNDSKEEGVDVKVASKARFLGLVTPLYLVVLFILYLVWTFSFLS